MDNDVAVRLENVSKKFCKSLRRSMYYGLKDIARNMAGFSSRCGELRRDEFWAVDDMSFEVKRGEVLGLIGPNGSGKTTLLKMINGIFWPDSGRVSVRGRVGALIAVGAGFHPLLTGRENIYINGAILGMGRREIAAKFDSIVDFADISNFLDTPVKNYSSGMFVRLGFSVAVHCEPEILLVDEVLAVGDEKFKRKSYQRLQKMLRNTTIVMVSHNMFQINHLCDKVIYMDKGRMKAIGDPESIVSRYYADSSALGEIESTIIKEESIKFEDIYFENYKGEKVDGFKVFDDVKLVLEFRCIEDMTESIFSFRFYNKEGLCISVLEHYTSFEKNDRERQRLEVDIRRFNFAPGEYTIEIKVAEKLSTAGVWLNALSFKVYVDDFKLLSYGRGCCVLNAQYKCNHVQGDEKDAP